MVEINLDEFKSMEQDKKDSFLFNNVCGTQDALISLNEKVDTLLASPWRMLNLPAINWKLLCGFILAMAAILKGDISILTRALGALAGM